MKTPVIYLKKLLLGRILACIFLIIYSNNVFCQVNGETKRSSNTTEDVNTLWDRAQMALENDNTDLVINLLKQIINNVPRNHPLFVDCYINLADIYANKGNTVEMEKAIKALETYPNPDSELKDELKKLKYSCKNAVPFENDLCGIWVSDFSYNNKQGLPYIVLKIQYRLDKRPQI